MNLGKAIKTIRTGKGLSQTDLAHLSNITQAALSQIENGKRPGTFTLKKISKALDIPESLIYVMGIEMDDIPAKKRKLYGDLFPVIESLILKLST